MYCNYYLEVEEKVAVVTEIDFTMDESSPVRVVSGYAFDYSGKSVSLWSMLDREFVDKLVTNWEL